MVVSGERRFAPRGFAALGFWGPWQLQTAETVLLSPFSRTACRNASLSPMRQLQPVLWTKGVLLSPQHLQLQDRFFEDSLNFQLSSLTFSPWGLLRLAVARGTPGTRKMRPRARG